MTNLNSILKSRDTTFSTKVCLVKAMVFPVVMYECESWTTKKAERRRIDDFELWCWDRGSFPDPGRSYMPLSNYWAFALELGSHNYRAHMSQLLKWSCPRARAAQQEKLPQWEAQASQLETSPYLPELEKALLQQWRPSAAKNILKKWSHWRFTHYLGLHELGSKMQPKHNSCPCFLFNMIHLVFQLSHWTNWGWDKKFSYL